MRLTALILLTAFLHVSAASVAQRVTLTTQQATLKSVFRDIKKQTGYNFLYNEQLIAHATPVTVTLNDVELELALEQLFADQQLAFTIDSKTVVVRAKRDGTGHQAQYDARGQVIDSLGNPLSNVTVRIKGTTRATFTDAQGQFTLSRVEPQAMLQISMVGYESIELPAGGGSPLRILLRATNTVMDETVVIGYGTRRRSEITGSVARVGELKPEENLVSHPIGALQGRVAGLHVQNTGSSPGSAPNFVVRGVQTTQGNLGGTGANPLIVIDGLVVDAIGAPMTPTSTGANFNLSNLNPQDIASVEVLKDAASSAIYGARGAQGVILITTKKGQLNSKPTIALNSYYGFTTTQFGYRPMNRSEYQLIFNESRENRIGDIDGRLAGGGLTPAQIAALNSEKNQLNAQIDNLQLEPNDFNWVDKLMPDRPGMHNIQASVSGGSGKSGYYLSFGKFGEDNSIGKGRFNRYSGKLSVTQQLYPWLTVAGDISISNGLADNIVGNLFGAIAARPDMPEEIARNADGTYGYWFGAQEHPYGAMEGYRPTTSTWNYVGNAMAEVKLPKNFAFRTMLAASKSDIDDRYFYTPFSYEGQYAGGSLSTTLNNGLRYTFNNLLTYRLRFSQLEGDAVLGQEFTENRYATQGYVLEGFPSSEGLWAPGNAATYNNNYRYLNRQYLENSSSYFLRTNLSWAGKYLFSASLRHDGSSKLRNFRYAWFPAVSAGWLLGQEEFLKGQSWIGYLKLRASYGITGNIRPLGLFDVMTMAATQTYLNQPALQLGTVLGNPDLKWERTKQYDAGVEGRFFDGRIDLTAEYYVKNTDGLFTSLQIPFSSGGFSSQRGNLGGMRNSGLDLSLSVGSPSRHAGDFTWRVGVDANINRNRVTQLRDSIIGYGGYIPAGPRGFIRVGQPAGLLQLYNALGVDDQTGDVIYEDRNRDGVINQADMIYVPTAQPKMTGGFHTDLAYKRFSLSALFVFTAGNKVYNYSDQDARQYGFNNFTGVMDNKPEWVLDRWTGPGSDSRYPRAVVGPHGAGQTNDWNNRVSTLYLFDASYLRFKNLTFGYDVVTPGLKRIGFSKCRVYVAGQNLYLWRDRALTSNDPEQAMESGWQQGIAPMPRTYSLGLDITF